MSKMKKYTDYLSTKINLDSFESLFESKIVLSKNFISILNIMSDDNIAKELIKISNTEVDVNKYNYIDSMSDRDHLSFISDDKAQKILNDTREIIYNVIDGGKYLTHSDKNDQVFKRLGYEKDGRENWAPPVGTIVSILNETDSNSGNKTYCLVKLSDGDKLGVINKSALSEFDDYRSGVWKKSRNPINVGRLVRSILLSIKFSFTDVDLNKFVDLYKSKHDYINNQSRLFEIVTGDEIRHWYNGSNYSGFGGSLSNSCMKGPECQNYLYIYSMNDVRMLVLFTDDDKKTIRGRAIIWNATIDDTNVTFMDRIYTNDDCDINLFKSFAEDSGWYNKMEQDMETDFTIQFGSKTINNPKIKVSLKNIDYGQYPYMDTMCYFYYESGLLTNFSTGDNYYKELRDTSGGYEGDGYEDDFYEDEDDY